MSLHRRLERLERNAPPEEAPRTDWEALAPAIELKIARELDIAHLAPVERYRAVKTYLETAPRLYMNHPYMDYLTVGIWRSVRCRQLGLNRGTELWYWRHNDDGVLVDTDPLEARKPERGSTGL